MNQDVTHDDDHAAERPHRRPRHFAERMEGYVGIGMAVLGGLLLVGMLVAFTQTGNGTPAWMH